MASSIEGAVDDLAASSGLLSAFRSTFGGNSKAMAGALGVTPRAVQRYYTTGAQRRAPSPATRAKMAAHVPVQANVRGQFYFDSPGFRSRPDTRDRNITFTISAAEMAGIRDAARAGNDDLARERFFEAYGMAAPDSVIGAQYSFSPAR